MQALHMKAQRCRCMSAARSRGGENLDTSSVLRSALAVTLETSSPAFLNPQRTIARSYSEPRIKTQSSPDLCTSLLRCQTGLHSLRSPSTSAKNGSLRNTSAMPIASYSVRYLAPPTFIRCPFSRSSLTRLSLNPNPFCLSMVPWHVFENRSLPNPHSCLN